MFLNPTSSTNCYRSLTDKPKGGITSGPAYLRDPINSLPSYKLPTSQYSTSALTTKSVCSSEMLAHSQNIIRHNNPNCHIQMFVKTSDLTNRR